GSPRASPAQRRAPAVPDLHRPRRGGRLAILPPRTTVSAPQDTDTLLNVVRKSELGKVEGLILGSYKILKPLAKGGMGVVYLAEHVERQRRVALKVCMRDQAGAGAIERF